MTAIESSPSASDPEEAHDLTNLWHQASVAFGEAGNKEMQRLCQIKGDYWLDPHNWEQEDIDEAGIRLAEMRSELNKLLAT